MKTKATYAEFFDLNVLRLTSERSSATSAESDMVARKWVDKSQRGDEHKNCSLAKQR